jgi:beta-glucanase (GH16 family)
MRRNILNPVKSFIILLLPVLILLSCSKKSDLGNNVNVPPPVDTTKTTTDTTKYTLLWSDEFTGTSVDQTKWTFETGNLGVNQEEEYYQASNATVANGYLSITAQNQPQGGQPFTSARMNTASKFSVTYGKIEARIKLPIGAGLWPAFWMLGADINSGVNWPSCGEVDIMEHINTDSLIYGSMHWSGGSQEQSVSLSLSSSPSEWHIYSVTWDTNSIKWYVDNTLYSTGNIANDVNSTDAFHKPFFIIMNMAVGGSWPGSYVDVSKLPATMLVDYVRVYQASN